MSITPAVFDPQLPAPPPQPPASKALALLLGLALGFVLATLLARSYYQPKILEQAILGSDCKLELDSIKTERREWVTLMVEPGPPEESTAGASLLGALVGTYLGVGPATGASAAQAYANATASPSTVYGWGVPGKIKPISKKPGVAFVWLNQRTGQKLGPFQPLTNPEAP